MILLFEEDEQEFKNLGLGVLKDALSCKVTEGLNDEYELAMEYPLNGQFCSSIKIGRLIYCKPNPYSAAQPFRIYDISKTLHRTISVSASHISYDLGGLPVVALKKGTLTAIIDELQNGCIVDNPFKFYTDILSDKTYEVTSPTNIRSILMSTSGSLVEKYSGEFLFDKFDVRFLTRRGENRGVQVRYGKNITDLKHDISYDNLYNGIYPFYHTETTSSTTTASGTFTKVYIVGTKPLQDGWLSYTSGGAAYHPIDTSPVQIATEGEYKDKVYCWNTNTQRYEEKIYNQSVTLIEGVISPDWIYIDWASFPIITCKAGKDGYFRTATDTSYGSEKKTGDVIFQGSITSSDTLSNIILYYSEVIPSSTSSTTTETTDIVNVEIDDKIIWLESDASKSMKYNRILPLDLTSYFTESPTSDTLKAKAEEYISKNKLGQIKLTTDVSFIDASSSVEASSLKDLEKVELGDTVKVVYEDQNIDVDLRVITTLYDVVKGRYEKITLGDKDSKLSGTSVQAGDNVSSLTNDSGYADVTTVKKLIADTVTADYLYSKNAELTNAQIQELSTVRINCTGIIEASQFSIDTLVAKLLTAENAEISKVLKAGEIKVSGDVDITSGSIKIYSNGGESYFIVDNEGNLTANSVDIAGGTLSLGNGIFLVDQDGRLYAENATISGEISSTSGSIGGFTISDSSIYVGIKTYDYNSNIGVYIGTDGIRLGNSFRVTSLGALTAEKATLTSATITGKITATSGFIGTSTDGFTISSNSISKGILGLDGSVYICTGSTAKTSIAGSDVIDGWALTAGTNFGVTNSGKLYVKDASIYGEIVSSKGTIGGFTITEDSLYSGDIKSFTEVYTDKSGVYISQSGIRIGSNLIINQNGMIKSKKDGETVTTGFSVSEEGKLTASDAEISGNISALSGYIGTDDDGFSIKSSGISNTITGLRVSGEENTVGVYIGTDGLRVGKEADITGDPYLDDYTVPSNNPITINLPYYSQKYRLYFSIAIAGSAIMVKDSNMATLYPATVIGTTTKYIEFTTSDSSKTVSLYMGTYATVAGSAVVNSLKDSFNHIFLRANFLSSSTVTTSGVTATVPNKNQHYRLYFDLATAGGTIIIMDSDLNYLLNTTISSTSVKYVDFDNLNSKSITVSYGISSSMTNAEVRLSYNEGFYVNSSGKLYASDALVHGKIVADSGSIGNFSISDGGILYGYFGKSDSIYLSSGSSASASIGGSSAISGWAFIVSNTFGVAKDGSLYASSVHITGDGAVTTTGSGAILPLVGGTYQYYTSVTSTKHGGLSSDVKRYKESSHSTYLDECNVYVDPTGVRLSPVSSYTGSDKNLYPRAMFFGIQKTENFSDLYPGLVNTGLYIKTTLDGDTSADNYATFMVGGESAFYLSSKTDASDGKVAAGFQVSKLILSTVYGGLNVYHLEKSLTVGDVGLINSTDLTPSTSVGTTCAIKEPVLLKAGITSSKVSSDQWVEVASFNNSLYDVVNVVATLSVDSKNATGYGGALVYLETSNGYTNVWLANDGSENKYIRFIILYRYHYYY